MIIAVIPHWWMMLMTPRMIQKQLFWQQQGMQHQKFLPHQGAISKVVRVFWPRTSEMQLHLWALLVGSLYLPASNGRPPVIIFITHCLHCRKYGGKKKRHLIFYFCLSAQFEFFLELHSQKFSFKSKDFFVTSLNLQDIYFYVIIKSTHSKKFSVPHES